MAASLTTPGIFGTVVRMLGDSASMFAIGLADRQGAATARDLLSIDPRAFPARSSDKFSEPWIPTNEDLSATPDSIRLRRSRELKQLGFPEANVHSLSRCPGVLVPVADTSGCPRKPTMIAVVGLPDSTATQAFVQVYIAAADRKGSVGEFTVLRLTSIGDGRWRVAERVERIRIE